MTKTEAVTSGQNAQQVSFDLAELTKMYDFSGKTVAITGGAGVLGSAIAGALAGCGAKVAILDMNEDASKALIESMGDRGKQIFFFKFNALDRESVAQAAQDVIKSMGKLDCLINGAGGNKPQATTSAIDQAIQLAHALDYI